MLKILWIKFRWNIWCGLSNTGYRLMYSYKRHLLARVCFWIADKSFTVNDGDFALAYPSPLDSNLCYWKSYEEE